MSNKHAGTQTETLGFEQAPAYCCRMTEATLAELRNSFA